MDKIKNAEQSLGLFERFLALTKKYSLLDVLKAVAFAAIITVAATFLFYPERIFEIYDEYKERVHDEAMNQRTGSYSDIQLALDQLKVNTKADRVLFLEYHNGEVSAGGLPFKFINATYESLEDGVPSVAYQYRDIPLTLMPFAFYINKHKYYSGNVESLTDIDKSLMYKLMSNNVNHFAMIEVEGVRKPLGVLVLTYAHNVEHNCSYVKNRIQQTALNIAVHLELKRK